MMNGSHHSATCYSRNAMLAQPVLHRLAMEEAKNANAASAAPSTQKTDGSHQRMSKDLLERKMELHEQEMAASGSKAKGKVVRFWQHIISQSSAPAAKQSGGGLMRR